MEESLSLVLAADPEAVFALVGDFGRLAEWDPGVVESGWRGDGPSTGAVCDVVVRFLGMNARVAYELVDFDPPHLARYVGRARRMESIDTITVEPSPAGSRLRLGAAVSLSGSMLLLRPVLPMVFGRAARRAVASLHGIFSPEEAGPCPG